MRRRDLIVAVAAAALASPGRSRAERSPGAPPLIGLLSPFTRRDSEAWHQALRRGLGQLGWNDGGNLRIEARYADGREERLPGLAAEMVALKVDVIVASVATDAVVAAKATKTIPIVMASAGDPVASGLVASLSRPGGNVTGLTQVSTDLTGKRLELLKELAPAVSRLAVLWNPLDTTAVVTWHEIQAPAAQLKIALHSLEIQSADRLDGAFASVIDAGDNAIMALPAPLFVVAEKQIADFAMKNRLPSMFHLPEFPHVGGLLFYGPDRADLFRRAPAYVDKILKGAKPADLPVEQPTRFELVINVKTARALGLSVPQSILARADEVIE